MSEIIESHRMINLRKNQTNRSTIQLTFHIPQSMRARAEVIVEVITIADASTSENCKTIVTETATKYKEGIDTDLRAIPSPVADLKVEALSIIDEVQIEINEPISEVIPFFTLKLKNQPTVHKIGTSFLKDISLGHKYFGFTSLTKNLDDLHLLVYGSFINYTLNRPVLIVVRDINDISLDKYRKDFTKGSLWKWNTYDWGNLCFIDHKQIIEHSEELKHLDLSFITHEFAASLWALPEGNVQNEFQKASLTILGKINSVTFVVDRGKTKNKDLNKSVTYYKCFDIAVKGILVGGY